MQAANIQTKQAKALEGNTFVCGGESMLKTVAIYGANASGKSSIIKAIRACVGMVVTSHNYNENTTFDFVPFKFGDMNKPSTFAIRFLVEGIEYEYSFSMTRTEILAESLYYYPNNRRSLVFLRDETKGTDKKDIYEFRSAIRRPMDIAQNTSKKTLFISRASQMDREIAKDVFRYFNDHIVLDYIGYSSIAIESLLAEKKGLFLRALKMADSDIVDIKTHKDSISGNLVITTFHKSNSAVPFDFYTEESDGTKVLFRMMLTILNIIMDNKVLLIDEIETSLHVKLVEYIVSLFNKSDSAQLIYTTHSTYMLDTAKVRKDQVYFVNKREDGASDLYSLYDYKDYRENTNLEKAYLQGRFDAIPYLDDSVSNLKVNA